MSIINSLKYFPATNPAFLSPVAVPDILSEENIPLIVHQIIRINFTEMQNNLSLTNLLFFFGPIYQTPPVNKKSYTIPVFIPGAACPYGCIYCHQPRITGKGKAPRPEDLGEIIEPRLATIPRTNSRIELGFFGGSFTGLPISVQEAYLGAVQPWLNSGRLDAIRLSTRPDLISGTGLDLLRSFHVDTIELGAQSMDDEVLRLSGRGHTAADTIRSSVMIREGGFRLGLQMMIGLPGDTRGKAFETALRFIELGASDVRVYPTLVIRGTGLEDLYCSGGYAPLSLEEAVDWSAALLILFEQADTGVIRMGLHPSGGLLTGEDLVAGPFHPSFRELVLTSIWSGILDGLTPVPGKECIEISVAPGEIAYAAGHGSVNRKKLQSRYRKVVFRTDPGLAGRQCHVYYR
jgi:histone acetyltransferase (RNA polymerase elongator complex component)